MSDRVPDGIDRSRVIETAGPLAGTAPLFVLGTMIAMALLGLFGGIRSDSLLIRRPNADVSVAVPQTLRSGMFFETNIQAVARTPLTDATIGLSPSLWRSITINTAMPQATEEEFKDGFFRLHYGALDAGDAIRLKLDAQINPDLFAGNRGEVVLFDGDRQVASIPIQIAVLP